MNILFGTKKNLVLLIGALLTLILYFIDKGYGLGFLAGLIISIINTQLIEGYSYRILAVREYRSFPGFLFYLFRSFLLVIPFILTLIWPEYINIFAAVFGILYFKIVLFASVLTQGREG